MLSKTLSRIFFFALSAFLNYNVFRCTHTINHGMVLAVKKRSRKIKKRKRIFSVNSAPPPHTHTLMDVQINERRNVLTRAGVNFSQSEFASAWGGGVKFWASTVGGGINRKDPRKQKQSAAKSVKWQQQGPWQTGNVVNFWCVNRKPEKFSDLHWNLWNTHMHAMCLIFQ